jgi:hypothetical protein
MKPTRTCHWPPRLDVTLCATLPRARQTPARMRDRRAVHPRLRAVAQARWPGRIVRPRFFDLPCCARPPAA